MDLILNLLGMACPYNLEVSLFAPSSSFSPTSIASIHIAYVPSMSKAFAILSPMSYDFPFSMLPFSLSFPLSIGSLSFSDLLCGGAMDSFKAMLSVHTLLYNEPLSSPVVLSPGHNLPFV